MVCEIRAVKFFSVSCDVAADCCNEEQYKLWCYDRFVDLIRSVSKEKNS